MSTRILIGCGYLGYRVARLWRNAGDHTISTTRGEDPTPEMIEAGVFTGQLDVTKPETLHWLRNIPRLGGSSAESLVYSVGYDRTAGPDIHTVYAQGLKNVLNALPSTVKRVIYISTTGVYGNAGGAWVDEDTPPDPQRDGGRASLAAEQVLAESLFASRGIVLRLAGIYGPGRIPFLDKLRAGEPIPAVSTGYLNLIHVDDAAAVVVAAAGSANKTDVDRQPRVYCVSDGEPVERGDYYREVARLIGAPPPTFVAPDADSPRAERAESDRRVKNLRMLAELGVRLQFSDYRSGLAAILANGETVSPVANEPLKPV